MGNQASSTQHIRSIASGVVRTLMSREKGALPGELRYFQQRLGSSIHPLFPHEESLCSSSSQESASAVRALDTAQWPGILRPDLVKSRTHSPLPLAFCSAKCSVHSSVLTSRGQGFYFTALIALWLSGGGGWGGSHASRSWRRGQRVALGYGHWDWLNLGFCYNLLHGRPIKSLFFFFLSFVFLGPPPWHMEVSRLGVKSELQPLAYTTQCKI